MSHPSPRTDYEKRLVSLQECVQAIQRQDSPAELGKIVLAFLKEWFSFELVWLARYDTQEQILEGIDGVLPWEKDYASLLTLQPVLPGDLFDQVLLTGQIQTVVSLDKEPRAGNWQAIAQRQGIQGASILPIRFRRRSFGVLVVGTKLWGGHARAEELTELKMLTGALGVALSGMGTNLETAHGDSQTKVSAINAILEAKTFNDRLQLVLEQSYQMIQPARACFYWFDVDEQVCRLQDVYTGPPLRRTVSSRPAVALEIPLQQIHPFYQATLKNQMVSIADVESLIHSHNAPSRLMALTQSRAWLSVPLFDRQRLIGVLTIEEGKPRVWSDQHKQCLSLMAQLMSHFETNDDSTPFAGKQVHLPSLLNVLRETEPEADHWEKLLQQCLEQVGLQFAARWVSLFQYDADEQTFECRSQFCAKKKQPFPLQLPSVSGVDTKLLNRLTEPLAVPAAVQDLRFVAWHSIFSELGVQSYVLVKLGQETGLGQFLLLAADLPRTWTERECETIESIAQTIDQVLNQHAQRLMAQQQQQIVALIAQGLSQMQQSRPLQLVEVALDHIQQLLKTECTMILRWSLEEPAAKIALAINNSSFELDQSALIPVESDHLLQTLLTKTTLKGKTAFPGIATLRGTIRDLARNSEWLSGAGFVEILAVPIQTTPEQSSLGLILAFNTSRKGWSSLQREGLQILTRELASHALAHEIHQHLTQRCETLECLNWYKQRQLEQLNQHWGSQSQALRDLLEPEPVSAPLGISSIKSRPLSPMMQLMQSFSSLEDMLKTEIWELGLEGEVISIAALLRRSLARIEPIVSARQLWTQVHNLTPSVSVKMPSQKLELMITELLLASCYRTKVGDRIDIWCRALQDSWVEVSITDHGRLNPQLVKDLAQYTLTRTLTPILESVPGLHFKVCQSLVERLGGQLELSQLEDGRSLSRLILPTAT